MNERITEIEMQVARSFDPLRHLTQTEYNAEFSRRFAELIVRECASLAYDGPSGILEYFGIE